jgi:8-oxo-dGTP diphosphatase
MRTRVGVYVVATHDGRILLTQLADHTPHAGLWTLPGGGMEFGEQPGEALARELFEETGLVATEVALADAVAASGGGSQPWMRVRLLYTARVRGVPRVVEVGGSTVAVAWVPLDGLSALPLAPLVQDAVRVVEG